MITITRRQARSLRNVFRRSTLGIAHRGPLPPLLLLVDGEQIRVQYRSADLAVERVFASTGPATGSILLPLDALADLEGRTDTPLVLDPVTPDRTVARWTDCGISQVREFALPTRPQTGAFPDLPTDWAEVPGDPLLDALVAATATTTADSSRYALDCLLFRATPASHDIIATNGHEILVRGGFAFPWSGDVLVRSSTLFAARDLPRDRAWSVGRTATHVALRCSPWTIWLAIPTEARYPRVDQIVPESTSALARLRIDPTDSVFLAESLGRLPGADTHLAPVTVDLNGRIAIRASGPTDPAATAELVLSRSNYTGTPVRFGTNRNLLARAIRLGFAEVEVGEPGTPLVCRTGQTTYAWQPLSPEGTLESNPDLTRIESDPRHPAVVPRTPEPTPAPVVPVPVVRRIRSEPPRTTMGDDLATTGLLALIREAESLHETLATARTRSRQLVVALKRQRKQARLMASTLHTLRQLRLQEVTG